MTSLNNNQGHAGQRGQHAVRGAVGPLWNEVLQDARLVAPADFGSVQRTDLHGRREDDDDDGRECFYEGQILLNTGCLF